MSRSHLLLLACLTLLGCPQEEAGGWAAPSWQDAALEASELVLSAESEGQGTVEEAMGRALLRCAHPKAEVVSVERESGTQEWEVQGGKQVVWCKFTVQWEGPEPGPANSTVFLVNLSATDLTALDPVEGGDLFLNIESDTSQNAAAENWESAARSVAIRFKLDLERKIAFCRRNPAEGYTNREAQPVDVAKYLPDASTSQR